MDIKFEQTIKELEEDKPFIDFLIKLVDVTIILLIGLFLFFCINELIFVSKIIIKG